MRSKRPLKLLEAVENLDSNIIYEFQEGREAFNNHSDGN